MFTGIFPALLTPFTSDGEVDEAALRRLVDRMVEAGANGLYLCGSTGEGLLLREAERQMVAEIVIEHIDRRIPAIIHVGALATDTSERLARHARKIGAAAVASIPPFYFNVGPAGIVQHYRSISQAADLPTFFYNIPDATAFNLNSDLASRLFKQGVIQGIKYTSYDLLNLRSIIDACGPELVVFAGPDEMLLPILVMGATGGIGATYNCAPELFIGIFRAWEAGDLLEARSLQYEADRLVRAMAPFGIISAAKAVMRLLGLDCGNPRPPLLPLTSEQADTLRHDLQAAGLFEHGLLKIQAS